MLINLLRRLFHDRKGATALVMAIVLVPTMIAGITAIDMARIAAARTVLQAAVDSAAISGVGAYSTSGASAAATTAAQATYAGSTATLGQLTMSLTPSTDSGLVQTYCSVGTSCGSLPAECDGRPYCVEVTAKLTLSNLLLKWITPQTALSAHAVATAGQSTFTINPGSFSSTSVGNAMDISNILAYVVPPTATGDADFGTVPTANTACTGVISEEAADTTLPSGTNCNFALIGSSQGGSSSGTLNFSAGQYISFAFANLVGGSAGYGPDTTAKYYDQLTISSQSYPDGACATRSNGTWSLKDEQPTQCTGSASFPLYGECPSHNLYGSFSENTAGSLTSNGATAADALNIFSSAYEMLGYPPTYGTNHTLPSFAATTTLSVTSGQSSKSYSVSVQCPRWPTTAAAASSAGDSIQVPYNTNITAYSTYYPGKQVTNSGASVYPPPLQSGCSPAATYPSATS